jgi:hypothetical protein
MRTERDANPETMPDKLDFLRGRLKNAEPNFIEAQLTVGVCIPLREGTSSRLVVVNFIHTVTTN